MTQLFRFPNPVNEVSARIVAGGVVILALAYVVTGWLPLLAVLAYGFVARVLTGPRLSPLGLLATKVITPRLPLAPREVAGPPKRFAQGIGAVLSVTALILAVAGLETAARVAIGALLAAATLEAGFGFCLGCWIFGVLMRRGVVPDAVCEACNDITLRRPSPAS